VVAAINRVVRGGSFAAADDDLRAGERVGVLPAEFNSLTGIRCARAP
jgi:formylglycine-generating enzyme required for sulfatase activity